MHSRSPAETVANLSASYEAITDLIETLSDDDWATQSLCPDWDVRGVITHLISVEHVLTGWRPAAADDKLPFGGIGPFLEQSTEWSSERLVTEAAGILSARRDEVAALSDAELTSPSPTPVGPGTYQRFLDVRVFDFWVHERDITTPLGRSTEDGGPRAESAADEVEGSIGYIVGKKIGLPDGMSMTVRLTGPVTRDIHVAVDGRAKAVEDLDDPSVLLTADSLTFVQLACGRIDPQSAIDAGRVAWSGDAEWGERAARNLAFTM